MDSQAEKEQFLMIIQLNKKLIFKVCNSYCKDAEDRKDLVQEVMIRLWKSYGKYDERYKLSTWMYRIALNTAISHYRSDRSRKGSMVPLDESFLQIAEEAYDTGRDEQIKYLYDIITQLDEMNRALIILYLDNNSYKDIAEILGIGVSNVATKISRLKQHLKQQFART